MCFSRLLRKLVLSKALRNRFVGVDLFADAGGMSLGAQMAGVDVALAVENDPHAAATCRKNHPGTCVLEQGVEKLRSIDVPKKGRSSTVEVYVYEGWNRIATFELQTSTLTLQTSYLWGLDLSGTLQGAGGVGGLLKEGGLYPTFDANGNIMQKLDGTGTAVMSVDYDPFGNIIAGTLTGEYGFSTKPLIDGILMYYYGFRYYDPETGRWPSHDPIGEYGGINLYHFVYNNPINDQDYLGNLPMNPLKWYAYYKCIQAAKKVRDECAKKAPDCDNPPCDADEWWQIECLTKRREHIGGCTDEFQDLAKACQKGSSTKGKPPK